MIGSLHRCRVGWSAIVAVLMMAVVPAGHAADVSVLSSATPSGGFPVYGEAFARTINEGDPTLEVLPRNSTAASTVVAAPRRDLIHPGALRYLQEMGLTR